jgi:hypothetical protein
MAATAYDDINTALRAHGHDPDECKVAYDPPGPDADWIDVTLDIELSRGALRDLQVQGLEIYAPRPPFRPPPKTSPKTPARP